MNPPKTHCATYDYDYALNALRDEVNDAKPCAWTEWDNLVCESANTNSTIVYIYSDATDLLTVSDDVWKDVWKEHGLKGPWE